MKKGVGMKKKENKYNTNVTKASKRIEPVYTHTLYKLYN